MARTVRLTEDAARRMAAATRAYERGNRDQSPVMFRQAGEDGEPVRLGKTSAIWNKGTLTAIDVWENGTPPNETQTTGQTLTNCVNKFANVASGKWVILARAGNGYWYLIAAECP